MYRTQGVLALLALYMGLAHSFSWEIVLLQGNNLQFYNNGQLTHTENMPLKDYLISTILVAYNPVHNNLLLGFQNYPNNAIASFDIVTNKIETLVTKTAKVTSFAVDLPTETIFLVESIQHSEHCNLYSFPLYPGSQNAGNGNLLMTSRECFRHITVDSCGGYIYWAGGTKIQKARFDGSEREIVCDLRVTVDRLLALDIDQQTQKMFWIEEVQKYKGYYEMSIRRADLNGQNRRTLYIHTYDTRIGPLKVSNDFIYWAEWQHQTFWQIPKIPPHNRHVKPKKTIAEADFCWNCHFAAYKTQGNQTCEALKSDSFNDSTDVNLLCVHGTQVSGESRCECTKGYSGERCNIAVCLNYCFQGDCSVSAERQPKCRCKATFSGERCEYNACHEYCLNNGICSLNERSEPVCRCTGHYGGARCNVPVVLVNCFHAYSSLRDILNTDLTQVALDSGVKSACAPTAV